MATRHDRSSEMTNSTRPLSGTTSNRLSWCWAVLVLVAAACGSTSESAGGSAEDRIETATTQAEPQAATTTQPVVQPEEVTDGPGFDDVTSTIESFVDRSDLDGAGFIVVDRNGGVLHEEYFGSFDAERVSMIASTSKMISAGVLLHAHDEGLLDLDAPIASFADWATGNPKITTAQLISNSSGLVPGNNEQPYPCQAILDTTLLGCGEAIMSTDADDASVAGPDTEFRYGGGQWQVAGAVAESVYGASWAELIEEIYVESCGVDSLGFASAGTLDGDFYSYPDWFDGDPTTLSESSNPLIEGGAYLNVPDFGTLLTMYLNGGSCGDQQVLSEAALDLMYTDRIGETYGGDAWSPDLGYGLGWWVQRSTGIVFNSGTWGALAWLDPDAGYGAYFVVENNKPSLEFAGGTLVPLLHEVVTGTGLR